MASIVEFIHQYLATSGTGYAFANSAQVGDIVLVFSENYTPNNVAATASDNLGTVYSQKNFTNGGNTNVTCLMGQVASAGTLSLAVTTASSDLGLYAYLLRGYGNTPLDLQSSFSVTTTPNTVTLNPASICSVFTFWGNENSNSFLSFVSETLDYQDTGHYAAAGHMLHVSAGSITAGVNQSTGSIGNVVVAIALAELYSGINLAWVTA